AKWSIDVEGLCLFGALAGTCRGVSDLADPAKSGQGPHAARAKHVAHQTMAFEHVEMTAIRRGNSSRILTSVLQQQQAVVDQLIVRSAIDDTNNSAHEISWVS